MTDDELISRLYLLGAVYFGENRSAGHTWWKFYDYQLDVDFSKTYGWRVSGFRELWGLPKSADVAYREVLRHCKLEVPSDP